MRLLFTAKNNAATERTGDRDVSKKNKIMPGPGSQTPLGAIFSSRRTTKGVIKYPKVAAVAQIKGIFRSIESFMEKELWFQK